MLLQIGYKKTLANKVSITTLAQTAPVPAFEASLSIDRAGVRTQTFEEADV